MRPIFRISASLLWFGVALASVGCGSPDKIAIELRKQNQQLHAESALLQKQHAADERTIAGLRDRVGTLPTLPTTRLAELFTTQGIQFGRLTGGAKFDSKKPGDGGFAVYITPIDETGGRLKAAGTFDIDAFDLAEPKDPHIGHWHFDLQQSRNAWTEVLLEYGYALMCPWQNRVPNHADLTIKVSFFDQLTQTPFAAERAIHIDLPPAKNPGQAILP